jgi:ADP-heptose:LPS heptosyltransferase
MVYWPAAKAPWHDRGSGDILVTRFKSIGDILFTLPAIHALRDNFPNSRITFLTLKENAPLVEGFRDVTEIVTLDRAAYRRGNIALLACEIFSVLRLMRTRKFSLAIDFQAFGETALLTWLTRAPCRWGPMHQRHRRWAYTGGIDQVRSSHSAGWNLSLLQHGGLTINPVRNEFILPAAAHREARKLFTQFNLNADRPVLFIQPFTSALCRNWPLENYLALGNHWRTRGVQVLFGGGPSERARLEPAERAGFPVAANAPLLVSAGLMKLSTLIVGGDTGLLHLAVAMNKRVVLLAIRSKHHPFQHPDWNITPADGSEMADIKVPAVIDACARAFAE